MKTFVFPGQGAQAKGMGGELFDEFSDLTDQADKILGYSIKTLCLEDPDEVLGQTQFTQVALYVVSALSWFKAIKDGGEKPDFVAGHSLGEYNALLAAEVFDFETGLRLVQKRGELMSQATGGGMAAIINCSEESIMATLRDNDLNQIEIANYNTPVQIVVSGVKTEIDQAAPIFKAAKIRFMPLKTSGAFHSSLMQSASDDFAAFLTGFSFANPTIPVISNVTAKPYENGQIAAGLASQIISSVRWTDTMQLLLGKESAKGSAKDEMDIVEIGHGVVLTKLLKGIVKYNASM